jgi:ATP-binding cassette subfamily B protein
VLGLVGRTGGGKTTIARLLLRLYDPQAGTVRIGSADKRTIDVRDLAPDELHRRIGMVTQEVQLFRATVRDNLTLFDPSIADRRILDALDRLGLSAWLARLPHADSESLLDVELAPGGTGLSAGEGQLLAFARVFLRDPGLVILDEAWSRLDRGTERLLERAVDGLLADRTAILIAHRLSTLERADDIAIVDDGQIVEYGPRAMLAAQPDSRFRALLDGRAFDESARELASYVG